MNRRPPRASGWGLLAAVVLLVAGIAVSWAETPPDAAAQTGAAPVWVTKATGIIDPALAGYLTRTMSRAADAGAAALVIEIDTPGGLDTAMRQIIQGQTRFAHPHRRVRVPRGGPGGVGRRLHPHGVRRGSDGPADQPGSGHPGGAGRHHGRHHEGEGHQRRRRLHHRSGQQPRPQRRLGRGGRAKVGLAPGRPGPRSERGRFRRNRSARAARGDRRLRDPAQGI